MIFLNSLLLFGGLAFAVPLIIHLLHRSKYKMVDWGAMMFLQDAVKVNSRRLQWQTWLLLLLRCAIPVVLALCMARPLLQNYFFEGTSISSLIGSSGDETQAILIVDKSISMQAPLGSSSKYAPKDTQTEPAGDESPEAVRVDQTLQNVSNTSVASEAKRAATAVIDRSSRNYRWGILDADDLDGLSNLESTAISRDKQQVQSKLDRLHFDDGRFGLMDKLESAISVLEKNPAAANRIIVMSDFQESEMEGILSSDLQSLKSRIASLAVPPKVVFLPIGDKTRRESVDASQSAVDPNIENLSVRIDRSTRDLVGLGQPWELKLRTKNHTTDLPRNIALTIHIDDVAVATRRLEVPAGSETQVAFSFSFPSAGTHAVIAKIENAEFVSGDNEAAWSVKVVDSIPTLVVSDDNQNLNPNDDYHWCDADYLTAALGQSPFDQHSIRDLKKNRDRNNRDRNTDYASVEDDDPTTLFNVERKQSGQLNKSDLETCQLLLLTNATRLQDETAKAVADWIAKGGVAVVFPGEATDFNWYNSLKQSEVDPKATDVSYRRPLLPMAFGEGRRADTNEVAAAENAGIDSDDTDEEQNSAIGIPLNKKTFQHPATTFLNDPRWGSMDALRFHRWIQLTPRTKESKTSATTRNVDRNRFVSFQSDSSSRVDRTIGEPSIAISFANGEPFLAIQEVGLGTILQYAVSPGQEWSNWPVKPVFLPMIQQAILTSIPPGRWRSNVEVGETITLPTDAMLMWLGCKRNDGNAAAKPTASNEEKSQQWLHWTFPQQHQKSIEQLFDRRRNEGDTGQPAIIAKKNGVYRAYTDQSITADASPRDLAQLKAVISVSSQIPASESDLRLAPLQRIDRIANDIGAKLVGSVDEYLTLDSQNSSELWRWFLYLLVILLFSEIILQRYITTGTVR